MNELQLFNNPRFGEVRALEIDGKPYFAGSDVAKALKYSNINDAVNRHCKKDGVVKHEVIDSLGRKQKANFIGEGNLYRLIVGSQLPEAEKFESWVFDEVLPTLRKHGGYLTEDTLEEVLLNPDTLIKLAINLKEEREKRQLLETENTKQAQIIGELQPKADYVDHILSSIGTMATTQIAADYNLTANKLNKILKDERIHRKVGDQWVLYKEHMGLGYTKSETIAIRRSDGRPDTKLFTKWTQKGRLMINETLNKQGVYANIDVIYTA